VLLCANTDIDILVDKFVEYINTHEQEPEFAKDVPPFLRVGPPLDQWKLSDKYTMDERYKWAIVPAENEQRITAIEQRIRRKYPPSFRSLLTLYSYPAFEAGRIMFFANTGERMFWEYSSQVFTDEGMMEFLLDKGFIYFGHPFFYNHNPVCFDLRNGLPEPPIVNVDHEEILCNKRLRIVEQTAESFTTYIQSVIEV
jgi:hypothetical protein